MVINNMFIVLTYNHFFYNISVQWIDYCNMIVNFNMVENTFIKSVQEFIIRVISNI